MVRTALSNRPKSPPASVLIVEGSGFYANHLKQVVEQLDCCCDIGLGMAEACSLVSRKQYDLICIARHLPDGTAPELAKRLRAQPETSRVPLVMVTADEDQEIFAEGYEAGFTEVFFRGELTRISDFFRFFTSSHREETLLSGRVLYLEDTKWIATVTIGLLHGMGLFVDHFTAVQPALDAYSQKQYDLVITDIVLKGAESGVSLVRKIRDMTEPKASVPILAVTGLEDTARRIELFRAGVSDYIGKPVLAEELRARVSQLVKNQHLLEKVQTLEAELAALVA